MANIFPIDFEEKLTMAQDDYILFSDSEDGNKIKKAQYKNLKGEKGDPGTPGADGKDGKDGTDGTAATITIGSTSTGAAGSSASVVNSGTSSAAVLDFTIPQGAKGEPGEDGQDGADGAAATITVGTTTTLSPGSSATVTNVGTSSAAVLNFGIPKGDSGTGSGDVSGPASSTDGDVVLFDGATGKKIKDSGKKLPSKVSDLTNDSGFVTSSIISDTAYGSGWDADTTHAPTKNAVYDKIDSMDTTIGNKANKSDVLEKTNATSYTPSDDYNPATKKYVDDKVADLMALGKFLSLWDCTTGQPISFPLDTPYTYSTGDYFMVETISTATPPVNNKPDGSSYTGSASSVTESGEVAKGDFYVYDGTVWLLATNHGKTVSFANLAGQPTDNANLATALGNKQDTLVSGTNIKTVNSTSLLGSGNINIGGDVQVSTQSGNILTSGMKIWAGTEADYGNLGTYDSNTVYLTV